MTDSVGSAELSERKKKNEDFVFAVDFKCDNCGMNWNEKYYFGDTIEAGWYGAWLASRDCTHDFGCRFCKKIKCSNCANDKKVSIVKREPIDSTILSSLESK